MDVTPVVQIDSREQMPLEITAYPTEVVPLKFGDYGVRGFSDMRCPRVIFERKSADDLVGSLTHGRERFMKEVEGLKRFECRALLIECWQGEIEMGQYRSLAKPASIMQTLSALQIRANLHVIFCGDHSGAARKLESLVRQFVRGILKDMKRLEAAAELAA